MAEEAKTQGPPSVDYKTLGKGKFLGEVIQAPVYAGEEPRTRIVYHALMQWNGEEWSTISWTR